MPVFTRSSGPSRPRLTPGVPAGGIAALLVAVGTIGWVVVAGDPAKDHLAHLPKLGHDIALSFGPEGIRTDMRSKVDVRADRLVATRYQVPDARTVDMAAITRSVARASEIAAKAATAKAESHESIMDGDIRYLDRATGPDGTNRITAIAQAPAGLRLANISGSVKIKVADNADDGILFVLENSRKRYSLSIEDGLLWITGPGPDSQPTVNLELTVPRGSPLLVNNFTGDMLVEGDLDAPVRIELANGEIKMGSVSSARVRVTQTGSVKIGNVSGLAAVQLQGHGGEVKLGNVGTAALEIAGNGEIKLGTVADGLAVAMPGPGSIKVGEANGPLSAAISGPGSLDIAAGDARNLAVGVTGPGTVDFAGTAGDPQILLTGPGKVVLAAHKGTPKVFHVGPGQVTLSR